MGTDHGNVSPHRGSRARSTFCQGVPWLTRQEWPLRRYVLVRASNRRVDLLTAEAARTSDHLDDAVRTVLALALTDLGREREAVSIAVGALTAHLPRYQRSMANYARLLVEPDPDAAPESDVRS
jgi:hypothetical protein